MQTDRTILPDCGLIDVDKLRRTRLCSFESVESLGVVITHTAPKQLFLLLFLKSPIVSACGVDSIATRPHSVLGATIFVLIFARLEIVAGTPGVDHPAAQQIASDISNGGSFRLLIHLEAHMPSYWCASI